MKFLDRLRKPYRAFPVGGVTRDFNLSRLEWAKPPQERHR